MAAALLKEQVDDAYGRCNEAAGSLNTALLLLEQPDGDAEAIRHALEVLDEASGHLASTMFHVGACRELALRAIDGVPAGAVANLLKAWERAQKAYVAVDQCRDHVVVALFLHSHRGVPGVDGLIENKRAAATAALGNAIRLADKCAGSARDAYGLPPAPPGNI